MSSEQRRLADRYVLEEPIGRGGMGEVWRATDTVLGRQVAVKTIDLRSVPDETGAVRFEREARATAGLNHPGVVTVHDSGVEGDTAYLVMELLPGPSLSERLDEGPLPVDEVVSVGEQVAAALDAAHARGLVHRDVKPGNVAYADDGRLRVLDFGITQLGDTSGTNHPLTATHTVMGTADYLSPEQALGGRVDGRADLYALGCLLFALLTGRPPYHGSTPVGTMMMHANDPVPDVRALRPDTPPWLAELVTGLLAKDPEQRPAGAATVAAALAAHEAPATPGATTVLPVGAAATGGAAAAAATQRLDAVPPPVAPLPPEPVEPPRRRSAALPWVIALLALLALGLLAWKVLGDGTGATPGPVASSPSTTAPAPTTPPATSATPTPTPTPTPSTPSPTQDTGAAVRDAVAAFRTRLDRLTKDGAVSKDAAKTLQGDPRDLEKAVRDGDPAAASDARDALRSDYDAAVSSGDIDPDGVSGLQPLLEDVSSAVDGYTG